MRRPGGGDSRPSPGGWRPRPVRLVKGVPPRTLAALLVAQALLFVGLVTLVVPRLWVAMDRSGALGSAAGVQDLLVVEGMTPFRSLYVASYVVGLLPGVLLGIGYVGWRQHHGSEEPMRRPVLVPLLTLATLQLSVLARSFREESDDLLESLDRAGVSFYGSFAIERSWTMLLVAAAGLAGV